MHTIFIYERSLGRLTLSFVKSDYVRDNALYRHDQPVRVAGRGTEGKGQGWSKLTVRGTPPTSPSPSASRSRFTPWCYTYRSWPAIASDPPPTSAGLACHVTRYLTRTYMYLPISGLFIISITLYISPYLQEDPYPFLFRSPARYVYV